MANKTIKTSIPVPEKIVTYSTSSQDKFERDVNKALARGGVEVLSTSCNQDPDGETVWNAIIRIKAHLCFKEKE